MMLVQAKERRRSAGRLNGAGRCARGFGRRSVFDYEKGKFGLFDLMDVNERTARILGREADIVTRDSLHKTLRRFMSLIVSPG